MNKLALAFQCLDDDPDQAAIIANEVFREDPDSQPAIYILGILYSRAERFGPALALFQRLTKLNPKRHEAWSNLGMCYMECAKYQEAVDNFKIAIDIEKKPEYMANLASAYLQQGNYTEAIRWAKKALVIDPEYAGAKTALGFAQLGTGDWAEGWKNYESCLGGKYRKIEKVGDEPAWDGKPVDNLFIYGEQGLGDEIMYASIIPDAIPYAKHIVLECDKRIKGLMQRSFPMIEVRGTRRAEKAWAEGRTFDAGCALASLATHFRPDKSSCPRTPYLIADPERRMQWRALFDSWGKPVVGLAWSGGKPATHKKLRNVGLESFRPYIEAHPEWQFVSLQYTDASDEIEESGLPVKHIARASQSPDYDDTAAFIAELDNIVGVHTTAHHVAGAMGKKSTILVPARALWNYATGDSLPWYRSQVFHRQRKDESWRDCIRRLV